MKPLFLQDFSLCYLGGEGRISWAVKRAPNTKMMADPAALSPIDMGTLMEAVFALDCFRDASEKKKKQTCVSKAGTGDEAK